MPEPTEAPIEDSGHPCFFHVDNCLLRPYCCWEWDVRVASQWLISSNVQPESLHSVDHPPRPSLRPLFKQFQEVGEALFRSSLISLAWRRASCWWRSTGSVYFSLPSGLSFRSWTLRASWNLIPFRAKISSSSLSWIRGSTSCRKALISTPEGWPLRISIFQPRRKLPITHGVLYKTSSCLCSSSNTSRISCW